MNSPDNYKVLTTKELYRFMAGKKIHLIDTLGEDHFRIVHIPNALSTCVYEVTFLEQVKKITEDKDADLILYGSSENSLDAATAARKLAQAGYRNLFVLKGGIKAWRSAGLPMEGDAVGEPDDPKTQLKLNHEDRKYKIDIDKSSINWTGRNLNSIHCGTIKLTKGEIVSNGNDITGIFEIDMNSIDDMDLAGNDLKPVLLAHLKSDDFFLTKFFPKATFEIVSASPIQDPYLSIPNFIINGNLRLRGIKAQQEFMATVLTTDENGFFAEAHFDIDRTRWGVLYGSTRFYEHLGMHLVFDLISLQIKIFAF